SRARSIVVVAATTRHQGERAHGEKQKHPVPLDPQENSPFAEAVWPASEYPSLNTREATVFARLSASRTRGGRWTSNAASRNCWTGRQSRTLSTPTAFTSPRTSPS